VMTNPSGLQMIQQSKALLLEFRCVQFIHTHRYSRFF
jgi:hypothetical protein